MLESLLSEQYSALPSYGESSEYRIVSTQGVFNVVGRRNGITQSWEFCHLEKGRE